MSDKNPFCCWTCGRPSDTELEHITHRCRARWNPLRWLHRRRRGDGSSAHVVVRGKKCALDGCVNQVWPADAPGIPRHCGEHNDLNP